MIKLRSLRVEVTAALGGSALLLGCSVPLESQQSKEQEIVGGNTSNTGPHILATGRLQLLDPSRDVTFCSGVLIAPDKVATAAHCTCVLFKENFRFHLWQDGNSANPSNPSDGVWELADVANFSCASKVLNGQSTIGDELEGSAGDFAILTLAPNSTFPVLPADLGILPVPVYLNNPRYSRDELSPEGTAVGFGAQNFEDVPADGKCDTCGTRKSCNLNVLEASNTYGTWKAAGIPAESCGVAQADSGSPLFFDLGGLKVVAGDLSRSDNQSYQMWGSYGSSLISNSQSKAGFIWEALSLPFNASLVSLKQQTAVYALEQFRLNDRAHIEFQPTRPPNSELGELWVVAGSSELSTSSRLGVDAEIRGDVFAGTRSFAMSNNSRIRGDATVAGGVSGGDVSGSLREGQFQRYPAFEAPSDPWNIGTQSHTWFAHHSVCTDADCNVFLAPGAYRDVNVNAGVTLNLSPGVYVFNNLQTESNSTVRLTNLDGPLWIFIKGNAILRGDVEGVASNVLWAQSSSSNAGQREMSRERLELIRIRLASGSSGYPNIVG